MKLSRGLTLLETVVSTAIFSVVMVVVVSSVLFFYRANTSSLEQSYQINEARRGVEFLVRDVREATTADDGSYPLSSIASTSITFFSDTDLDLGVERITYTLATTTFTRTVLDSSGVPVSYAGVGTTTIVSEYVRNLEEEVPIFRYYDEEGIEITDYAAVSSVRFVGISLVVNVLPIRAPAEFTLRSSATLRNLR
ncbi:MAG: prepilin-type N-terminal cleavage/methylation domain-containing protein [Patescibacteria group bacterium]